LEGIAGVQESDPPLAASFNSCVLAARPGRTHISFAGLAGGPGRPGSGDQSVWEAAMAPSGGHHPVAVRFAVGISNACAMLQLASKPDPSVPVVPAAVAPRMANDENRPGGAGGPATSVITKVKPKTKRPNLYRVLILNDDYTPMEFVVHVLEKFFQKDVEAATKIMLHVHHHGIGECGVFTYEIAETKVTQVMDFARKHQHPLQCVMEKK
jgi:ATP-dependent Clp protease adaptor protein ClpS